MAFCSLVTVVVSYVSQTAPILACLNGSFTFISSLCRCFGITSYQSIFPVSIPVGQELPTAEVVGKKLKQTLNAIKELLFNENNHVRVVGLCGMGGVGKTTLLKEFNNELDKSLNRSHGIDLVIWVLVSKDLNLKKIQDQIGNKLSLSWPEATEIEKRAVDIFNGLKNKKFVLLLDDIWEPVDLRIIGIPNVESNSNKKTTESRIVFTTRLEFVCGHMGARAIKVEHLDEDEAWNLFHQTVLKAWETSSSSTAHDESGPKLDPIICNLAKEIAKECQGLPLALNVVAGAMASQKDVEQWRYALNTLRKSAGKFSDMKDKVFPILKFSYDNLKDNKMKSCFLYCSLYPEDYPIKVEELIDLWIGEGFLDEDDDIEQARLEGHNVIGYLKSACLLEGSVKNRGHGNVEHVVKMHDVIRDLAISVASSDLGEINLKNSIPEQLNLDNWELAERISLMGSRGVSELTGAPECRKLSTLFLRGSGIGTLSDDFFRFMPKLKVLTMPQSMEISKLPTSISSLSALRYLNLSENYFSFDDLEPGTFSELVSLKILDLHNSNLRNWEKEGGPSLHELERLENLKSLGISIGTDLALRKLVTSDKLQLCTKKLSIDLKGGISSISLSPSSSETSVSLANMANLKILDLYSCDELKELRIPSRVLMEDKVPLCTSLEVLNLLSMPKLDIVCDMLHQQSLCFINLKHVAILSCPQLKDVSWMIYAQHLERLELGYQEGLEEIISDRFPSGVTKLSITFPRLQELVLEQLENLQRICSYNVKFPELKHMTVRGCPKLKNLSFDSGALRRIEGKREWWESLEWEDETTKYNLTPYYVELEF